MCVFIFISALISGGEDSSIHLACLATHGYLLPLPCSRTRIQLAKDILLNVSQLKLPLTITLPDSLSAID